MTRLAIFSGVAAASLLLASCGHSPPTRFFTLDPLPPSGAAPASRIAPVQLEAVHIPPALDRPEMVTQVGANRLKLSEQDQWAAPFGEMMRRALAQDLLSRLPAGAFVLPEAPRPEGARGLVVNVLQLQTEAGGRTDLQASWTLIAGHPRRAVLTRTVSLSVTASGDAQGQAGAVSRLLGQLADQIASALASS